MNYYYITKLALIVSIFTLISCSKPTLPVHRMSKFVITDVHFDSINYYQIIDINNIGTRLNRIDGQWFTDSAKHNLYDTLKF